MKSVMYGMNTSRTGHCVLDYHNVLKTTRVNNIVTMIILLQLHIMIFHDIYVITVLQLYDVVKSCYIYELQYHKLN